MWWLVTPCRSGAVQQGHCGLSQAARALGVDCLVAPYEADAQLAYLNKAGIVQAVITEDSDLLAFGCKKVLNCSCCTHAMGGWGGELCVLGSQRPRLEYLFMSLSICELLYHLGLVCFCGFW